MSENEAKRKIIEERMQSHRQASAKRCENFRSLLEGIYQTYTEERLDLEDRQLDSINMLVQNSTAEKIDYRMASGYFHACTAFGKSYLMMALAESYRSQSKNKKIVIFEENTAVLEQIKQDFIEKTSFSASDIGTFYGKEKTINTPIIICTYASMEKMMETVGKENIGLALCDEAHHILSENRQRVAKSLDSACLYGFTATPTYNNDKNCAQVFGQIIDSVTIADGVRNHLLCGVKNGLLVASVPLDLTGIKSTNGDYDEEKLMEAIAKVSPKSGIKQAIVDYYFEDKIDINEQIRGKTTIINVPSQREANELAQMMNERAGDTIAKAYHSRSKDEVLQEFNRGDFPVLIQVNRLTEGYNNPKAEVCINYPTASYVRATQRGGRVLRYDPENHLKLALVLDIAFMQNREGNIYAEIAKNGQVLFKDIAGGVYITPPEYPIDEEIDKKQDRERKDASKREFEPKTEDGISFTAIIDTHELLRINWEYEKYKMQAFIPPKKDNDIGYNDFIKNYQVCLADGTVLKVEEKIKLYNKLITNERLRAEGIVAERKISSGRVFTFIIGDKLDDFTSITDYVISEKENNTMISPKKDNDIGYTDFIENYQVFKPDGTVLTVAEKIKLYKELIANERLRDEGIVANRKTSQGRVFPFIIGDKLEEFNRITDYKISDKDNAIPPKKDNDIGNCDFRNNYQVCLADGTVLRQEEKINLYKELIAREDLRAEGIVAERKTSSGQVFTFIIGDKLEEFNRITDYVISEKENNTMIPPKKDNDIGYNDFIKNYQVCQADGTVLKVEKKKLYNKLITNERLRDEGIVAERKTSQGKVFPFIIGDKLDDFTSISGYVISEKENNTMIPPKKDNDIGNCDFINNYQVCLADGTVLKIEEKIKLYNELITNERLRAEGIVAERKISSGCVFHFIIGDKLEEFTSITGYRIITLREKLQALQEQASESQTPEERRKYLAKAKKIFERINPKLKGEKVCRECIKKISNERE